MSKYYFININALKKYHNVVAYEKLIFHNYLFRAVISNNNQGASYEKALFLHL